MPLSTLLGLSDAPGELVDRSGFVPGEVLRDQIADALEPDSRDEVLFTRLMTDDGGRLLDTTELGRFASARLAQAIKVRAGSCRFPTCNVPADRCDLDHHEPWPNGPSRQTTSIPYVGVTIAANLRLARQHPRPRRSRLDHARRRTVPVYGRAATHRRVS